MDKQKISHIVSDYYNKLNGHLEAIQTGYDEAAIHHFRVSYKKLRALFRLVSRFGKHSLKMPGKLKKGYQLLGSLRDLQLQQKRIKDATRGDTNKPRAYLGILQKEINRLKTEFTALPIKNTLRESRKKAAAVIPGEISTRKIKDFAKLKWATVYAVILSRQFGDDSMHTIRKELKDLLYNHQLLEEKGNNAIAPVLWVGNKASGVDKLLDELGEFQDSCTAIALLPPYRLNSLTTINREQMEALKSKWLLGKRQMKRKLVSQLRAALQQPTH